VPALFDCLAIVAAIADVDVEVMLVPADNEETVTRHVAPHAFGGSASFVSQAPARRNAFLPTIRRRYVKNASQGKLQFEIWNV
jgi:hypothetical protein